MVDIAGFTANNLSYLLRLMHPSAPGIPCEAACGDGLACALVRTRRSVAVSRALEDTVPPLDRTTNWRLHCRGPEAIHSFLRISTHIHATLKRQVQVHPRRDDESGEDRLNMPYTSLDPP